MLAQIGLHPAAQSALLVPALVPRRHVEKGGGEEGRGQLSSYLEPDPSHPPRVGEGRRGEAADCGETGRSWEVSREMCQARSPREPKPEAVCVLPSLTLTLFLTILSLFSFQGGWELDPGPGSTPQDQAVAAKTEDNKSQEYSTQRPFDLGHQTVWRKSTCRPGLSPTCPGHRLDFNLQALRHSERQLTSGHFPPPIPM